MVFEDYKLIINATIKFIWSLQNTTWTDQLYSVNSLKGYVVALYHTQYKLTSCILPTTSSVIWSWCVSQWIV
jgi:hypothetical protein